MEINIDGGNYFRDAHPKYHTINGLRVDLR